MSRDLLKCLDPELQKAVKSMLNQTQPVSFADINEARAQGKKMSAELKAHRPPFKGILTEDRVIPGPAGAPDVAIRIYRPEQVSAMLPVLLWIHGGGYMLGDIEQDDLLAFQFARAAQCVVVSVEYRLAPENPYPAALEDCYTALKWLRDHNREQNIDKSRIAIGGGSAGGGLAAALALFARDRGDVPIIYQLLVYPMIDDRTTSPAGAGCPDALFWTRESNLKGWRAYLGREPGTDGISGYAAAARAGNLRDLPPAYIAVGDLDLFAVEDIEYARRLIATEVSTELHVYPGGCHAFDMISPDSAFSQKFTGDIHRALKKALHG